MAPKASNDQHVAWLTARLGDEFSDVASLDAVAEVVRAEYDRLCRESKVTDFVPILVERRVRARMSRWLTDQRDPQPTSEGLAS
jgi:hypothetical protein